MRRAHSYSSLTKWRQCPRQYEAIYISKSVRDTGSSASMRGDVIHKELEKYIKGETEALPSTPPADGLHHDLRALRAAGAPVGVEEQLAVDRNFDQCGYWDKEAFLRGKMDVVVPSEDSVLGIDWKSGKRTRNQFQAAAYALMLQPMAEDRPVLVVFDYLNNGRDKPIQPTGADMAEVVETALAAENATTFPPKPTPLCRWCPVLTCEFNEKEA